MNESAAGGAVLQFKATWNGGKENKVVFLEKKS